MERGDLLEAYGNIEYRGKKLMLYSSAELTNLGKSIQEKFYCKLDHSNGIFILGGYSWAVCSPEIKDHVVLVTNYIKIRKKWPKQIVIK